jgi:hypothetical protein
MRERCLSMYLTRLKNSAPVCLLAVVLAGALVAVPAAGAGWVGSQSFPLAHANASPFTPLARAHASSALTSVNEWGRLKKQSSKGYTIDEKGVGWGTFNCSVLQQMTLNGTLVTATYTAYLSGGTISGTATAHIYSLIKESGGEFAHFRGTITLSRGTGTRAGASGTAHFSGKINHESFEMTTHISGNLRI